MTRSRRLSAAPELTRAFPIGSLNQLFTFGGAAAVGSDTAWVSRVRLGEAVGLGGQAWGCSRSSGSGM